MIAPSLTTKEVVDADVSADELAYTHDEMTFFYIVACVTGIFLILLVCVVVMLIKSRRKSRRPQDLFLYDPHEDISVCKSAPMSRQSSPTREKRHSCPMAYGAIDEDVSVSAAVSDALPQFETERIQPASDGEKGRGPGYTRYSPSLTETRRVQLPYIRIGSEGNITGVGRAPGFQGRIWFSVFYTTDSEELIVTLIKVRELEGRFEEDQLRDPFVRVFLLPDEHTYHTSRIQRKTLNPVYNEVFTFEVKGKNLNVMKLRFSVYDVDRRRIRHSLGHAVVPLDELDLGSADIIWRDLEEGIHISPSMGEMNLALTYLPHLERMKVAILRARHIRHPSDPDAGFYVRIKFCYGNKHIKTKQTLTQVGVGREINFNESFAFSTSNKNIENFNFTIALMQTLRSSLCNDIEIGHVTLGSFMHARGEGLLHWQEMLTKTRSVVMKWHQLNMPSV